VTLPSLGQEVISMSAPAGSGTGAPASSDSPGNHRRHVVEKCGVELGTVLLP
jgi:hypothetical protein